MGDLQMNLFFNLSGHITAPKGDDTNEIISTRTNDTRAIERARCVSRRPSPFAQSAWRNSGTPFPFPQSVLLPARRHINLGIGPDRFSAPPQILAALPSADLVSVANHPVVREPGQA